MIWNKYVSIISVVISMLFIPTVSIAWNPSSSGSVRWDTIDDATGDTSVTVSGALTLDPTGNIVLKAGTTTTEYLTIDNSGPAAAKCRMYATGAGITLRAPSNKDIRFETASGSGKIVFAPNGSVESHAFEESGDYLQLRADDKKFRLYAESNALDLYVADTSDFFRFTTNSDVPTLEDVGGSGFFMKSSHTSKKATIMAAINYADDSNAGANAIDISLVDYSTTLAYFEGMKISFKVQTVNTGAVTVNVNSLGTKAVVSQDGTALSGGELVDDGVFTAVYDGTSFVLQGVQAASSSASNENTIVMGPGQIAAAMWDNDGPVGAVNMSTFYAFYKTVSDGANAIIALPFPECGSSETVKYTSIKIYYYCDASYDNIDVLLKSKERSAGTVATEDTANDIGDGVTTSYSNGEVLSGDVTLSLSKSYFLDVTWNNTTADAQFIFMQIIITYSRS